MGVTPIARKDIKPFNHFWDETIEAFNELIQNNWHNDSATILQKDAENRILEKILIKYNSDHESYYRDLMYKTHQLDVEDLYRKQGFKVEFDKPGFNESYAPHYIFK